MTDTADTADITSLTSGVLASEGRHADGAGDVDIAIDELPGVADEDMSFRRGLLLGGGAYTFLVLLLLNSLDELESAALTILGPDIGTSLGVSDGVIVFITSAAAAFVVLGIVPMGLLADRVRRGPIVGFSSLAFGFAALLSGLAANAFMLFWARLLSGVAKANTGPVHSSLLADTYPIGIRGRVASTIGTVGRFVGVASPLLVGGIAVWFGGADEGGWRWAFIILGIPVGIVAFAAFRIKEPPRGQWERKSVLGELPADDAQVPVSIEMAFARLLQNRTLKAMIIALIALGFQLFPMASLTSFFLRDEYGLDAWERGLVISGAGALSVVVLPLIGRRFDTLYRTGPDRALRIVAFLILPAALLTPIQYSMPNAVLFTIVAIPGAVFSTAAYTMLLGPIIQSVIPYRLRSLGIALAALYFFLFGAVGGALIGAMLASSYGEATAIIVLSIPTSIVGAYFLVRGSRSIDEDLADIVVDIRSEEAERERQAADPEHIPALQVMDVDFSYGSVQVLFGVNVEVARSETLALLGTNGAGKSTILRVISGLGTPARGQVRLGGRTITFTSPEHRARLGIQLLPGGKGTFRSLSVADNLRMGAQILDRSVRAERIERVYDLLPDLRTKRSAPASSLSGGQQQQLALGRVLLHDPEILLIDELSLGLAPAVVADLLRTLERLKQAGQTMIIVEQSLNVALAIADRAVFLEKGAVRFDGPARELAERDDLARAVFLGST
jgi:ABC-type branched-subunit amino acid transport system ATPase component/predicted MFS family arabinose efflux permease